MFSAWVFPARRLQLAFAVGLLAACGAAPPSTAPEGPVRQGDPVDSCSQLHRLVAAWQGDGDATCGPDLSGLVELVALGDGRLLFHRRFAQHDDVVTMHADGTFDAEPMPVGQPSGELLPIGTASLVPLPPGEGSAAAAGPRVLLYDPRLPLWLLFTAARPDRGSVFGATELLLSPQRGEWPAGRWEGPLTAPWNHVFVGLDEGLLLDVHQGTGAFRSWRFTTGDLGEARLDGPSEASPGPGPRALRRGHRLVALGAGRLLEWTPRPCARPRGGEAAPCTGADYRIWRYRQGTESALSLGFDAQPEAAGFWPDVGAGHEIARAAAGHLVVWAKDSGELRSYRVDDAAGGNPLAGGVVSSLASARLAAPRWTPPTASPELRNLVVVLQDGHSFDAYFGRYCHHPASDAAAPPDCVTGADCCDAMPMAVPGAPACRVVDPEADTHVAIDGPTCMRAKMNSGAMDAFATARPGGTACGDPADFACAADASGDDPGAVGLYHDLARQGALADRFFQSYAYAGASDEEAGASPSPRDQNFLYLLTSRFSPSFAELVGRPLLTKELARVAVPWAVYTGDETLSRFNLFGIPLFYDPAWSPFRSIARELDEDVAAGALPSVTIVVPDGDDVERSEAPGKPFGNGIRFVDRLVKAIEVGPQANDTLVLVAHMTAGGLFDHVAPPAAPPLEVDATRDERERGQPIYYGPRVPLLALGLFARRDHIAHGALEMSSIAAFIEWNWLRGKGLKGAGQTQDVRRYRDTTVANLGELLDPAAMAVTVPSGAP